MSGWKVHVTNVRYFERGLRVKLDASNRELPRNLMRKTGGFWAAERSEAA